MAGVAFFDFSRLTADQAVWLTEVVNNYTFDFIRCRARLWDYYRKKKFPVFVANTGQMGYPGYAAATWRYQTVIDDHPSNMVKENFQGLFVHEIGHIVDGLVLGTKMRRGITLAFKLAYPGVNRWDQIAHPFCNAFARPYSPYRPQDDPNYPVDPYPQVWTAIKKAIG